MTQLTTLKSRSRPIWIAHKGKDDILGWLYVMKKIVHGFLTHLNEEVVRNALLILIEVNKKKYHEVKSR